MQGKRVQTHTVIRIRLKPQSVRISSLQGLPHHYTVDIENRSSPLHPDLISLCHPREVLKTAFPFMDETHITCHIPMTWPESKIYTDRKNGRFLGRNLQESYFSIRDLIYKRYGFALTYYKLIFLTMIKGFKKYIFPKWLRHVI